jgi:hypothetical protein
MHFLQVGIITCKFVSLPRGHPCYSNSIVHSVHCTKLNYAAEEVKVQGRLTDDRYKGAQEAKSKSEGRILTLELHCLIFCS